MTPAKIDCAGDIDQPLTRSGIMTTGTSYVWVRSLLTDGIRDLILISYIFNHQRQGADPKKVIWEL